MPVSAGAQAFHERITVDTGNRCFARRINIGDDNGVGIVETRAEIFEQIFDTGVPVRLHHRDNVTLCAGTGGGEDGGNFHGMMTVIVDHGYVVDNAGAG